MNKIITGVFIVFLGILSLLVISANTIGAPSLAYVYSNSMEPVIKVNDAFLVWPENNYQVGDIIMYRPTVLNAENITHRIVAESPEGFETWGDNSPSKDQDAGEPFVTKQKIVGKVVEFRGEPIVIHNLGAITSSITNNLRQTALYATVFFLFLGLFSMIFNKGKKKRKSARKKRWRLGDVYKIIGILFVSAVLFGILIGSRTQQLRILVSENPGSSEERVQLGQVDKISIDIKNSSFFPIWSITETYEPFVSVEQSIFVPPLKDASIALLVEPIVSTGYIQGYVKVTNYPIILPRLLISAAHNLSPFLGLAVIGVGLSFWTLLFFTIVDYIPGFHSYIPLSELQTGLSKRRWRRRKNKLIGGRRRTS